MKVDDQRMEYQILESAETLFLQQGFAKTTIGQIAQLSGCNQALVHYYYRTKDNLFEKIFEDKVRLLTSNLLAMDFVETTFEDKIVKMAGMHFDFLKRNPNLPTFILNEFTSSPERMHSLIDKLHQHPRVVFNQLTVDLEKEIEKGRIRPITTVDLIFTIISLNFAPFLILPMLKQVMSLSDEVIQEMLEQRKEETIRTILARLTQ